VPTVADLLVDGLLRAGTSRLFAGPAAKGSALVDAARLHDLAVSVAGSDTAACLMAAVTGELTGAPGVAVIPGAALAAAEGALAYARSEWAPLIVVTDGEGSPAALAKQSLRVGPSSAGHWIAHAARLSLAEPWGPVHLDVADSAGSAALPVAARATPDPEPAPETETLDRAAEVIARAQRPLIVAGRGARGPETVAWLRAFAEARPAPVLVTPKARGVMPDPHPLTLGTIGSLAADVLSRADLLVSIGVDPIELRGVDWPRIPLLRLARAAAEDGLELTLDVTGDPALTLEELAPRLRDAPRADWDVAELDRLKRSRVAPDTGSAAALVARTARELSPAGTVATVDAGDHAPAVMGAWQAVMPGELLASVLLGLPGFALPAAIAAQLARPKHRALCFTSLRIAPALGELATVVQTEPAPIVIVLPDRPPGVGAPTPPPFEDAARALGLRVPMASGPDTFGRELHAALAGVGPAVIVVADRVVYPPHTGWT
jgi:acetolactate synthase-1/2/3 large subunit